MASVGFAQVVNYTGFGDTAKIADKLLTNGIYDTTRVFNLTRGEDIRAMIKVNDTTSTGYASDSLLIEWGYQTGRFTYNSSGTRDTAWDVFIVLDTVKDDSLGKCKSGYVAADGSLTRYLGQVDTLNVSGYAVQSRWFVPEWDVLIRYWVKGITGNKATDTLNCVIEQHRRAYVGIGSGQ
jgi:hypothetical protein